MSRDISVPARGIAHVERPLWKQLQDRCVHYNGIALEDACDAGVVYAEVETPLTDQDQRTRIKRLPCLQMPQNSRPDTCRHFRLLTDEEAQAEQREIAESFESYWRKIGEGICPVHDRPMTMRQVGHCVYASCGCRLFQGKLP